MANSEDDNNQKELFLSRFGPLKEHVKFVIETRKNQFANSVQGLPGRVCGYHSNRDLIIYANNKKDITEIINLI